MGGGDAEDFPTVEAAMLEAEKERVHGLGFTRYVRNRLIVWWHFLMDCVDVIFLFISD